MVWRQLPKLIPAGSIPVSRSKKDPRKILGSFLERSSSNHRRTHVTTYGNGMSCACRFGLEEPCALAAQTPVSCSFPQAHAKHGSTAAACPASVGSGSKSLAPSRRKLPSPAPSHRRTQSMALRQRHAPRLSVRVRRALRPRGANSRLLLVRVQSDYKITLQTATGKLSDLYVKSAPAISRGAFLIDFFLVMRRWKSDRCNGLHTS